MNLFQSLDDLKPFIFRITDNGGASCDRFTIVTCDGDYFASNCYPTHPQGFFQSGEGIDMQGIAERVESGKERDLRWIDLPESVRNCVMYSLNEGFSYWLEFGTGHSCRDHAANYDGYWNPNRDMSPIYRDGDAFKVKDSDRAYEGEPDESFATFREAILYILPTDYTLSGPEYFTEVDLWDETDGAKPLWDCEEETQTDDGNESETGQ